MTSRSPDWISVGNLSGQGEIQCSLQGQKRGRSDPHLPLRVLQGGSPPPLAYRGTGTPERPRPTHKPSPNTRHTTTLGETGTQVPSLQQPFLVAATHKALMFSVTVEVYCGSVCGKTKHT